jgi:hypothetical protein
MSDLELLDPTRADDPAFDPDGAQAHRVRVAAMRARPAARPAPRRRLALGGAAVAAAALIAAVVGTSTAPPDAVAALREAARQTAAADSGRVLVMVKGEGPIAGYRVDARTEIRFQREDLELVVRSREAIPGGPEMERALTLRRIDGIAYERDDSRPGGRFRKLGKVDPVTFSVVGQVDDDGLVALVQSTRDVKAERDGDVTTYRGTTTAGAVEDAAPTAHSRSQGGEWDREVRLEVSVGEDGLIRHVTVRDREIVRTTRYSDLGEPQTIERP